MHIITITFAKPSVHSYHHIIQICYSIYSIDYYKCNDIVVIFYHVMCIVVYHNFLLYLTLFLNVVPFTNINKLMRMFHVQ